MKGIIFTVLADFATQTFGMDTWEKVLDRVDSATGGSYTAADTYSDSELLSLVGELSKETNTPPHDLIYGYGKYLLGVFAQKYPVFFKDDMELKDFLKSIDAVIHVEVKKLNPTANLPEMSYEDEREDQLVINYQSARKMCPLAEGLIQGAADHYKTKVHIDHPICMLKGADHCRLEVNFEGVSA